MVVLFNVVVDVSKKNHRWFQTRNNARPDPELRWPEVSVFNVSTGKEAYRFDRTPDSSSMSCQFARTRCLLSSFAVCISLWDHCWTYAPFFPANRLFLCHVLQSESTQTSNVLFRNVEGNPQKVYNKVLSHLQLYTKDGWDPIWF